MGLLWISVADKPGGDKGGEGVASEEELWVIKLCYSCHLCCLKLVNLVLKSFSCQRVHQIRRMRCQPSFV